MKLYISEPEPHSSGPILVYDEDNNDIAEFFHNENATVPQSYDTALSLACLLVNAEHHAMQENEPYIPNENTVRITNEEWRRLNSSIK